MRIIKEKANIKEIDIKLLMDNVSKRDGLRLVLGIESVMRADRSWDVIVSWGSTQETTLGAKAYHIVSDEFVEFYNSLNWVKIKR